MINHDYIRVNDQPYSDLMYGIRGGNGFCRGTYYTKGRPKIGKAPLYRAEVTVTTRDDKYTFHLEEKDYSTLVKKEQMYVDWYIKAQWRKYDKFCHYFPHEPRPLEPELLDLEIIETDLNGNTRVI